MIVEQEKQKELRSVTYIMQDDNAEKKQEKLYEVLKPRKKTSEKTKNDKIDEYEKKK